MLFKNLINKLFRYKRASHEADQSLIAVVGIILVFGLAMLSSATSAIAYIKYGDSYYFFKHQLFGLVLGLIVFWSLSKIDYHIWEKYGFLFFIISIVLLLLVFIPGLSANYGKARSWINVFGFSLQPSELVKLSFLIYLSTWLARRGKKIKNFSQGTAPFIIVLSFVAFLMIQQPDIGTLLIISIISIIVYFVGGGNIKHILVIILLGIFGLYIMLQIMPYQANRFKCFLDPSFSQSDICYQVNQSLIAVGSGGFWGRGFGASRQKFMYLPEVYGDSIFSIISEEIGMFFSSMLVFAYLFLFYKGYLISRHAPDMFGRILAIGISSWIVIQAIVNIGGMIALMPMTGVPLPFISYGGTAILSGLAAMGILVNISKYTKIARSSGLEPFKILCHKKK